jgi:hypothetical protein
MAIDLKIIEVHQPLLEFGSPGQYYDPKNGLINSGPFDLRFGTAKKRTLQVGIVGTNEMIHRTHDWLNRISHEILPTLNQPYNILFPGFKSAFHAEIIVNDSWIREINERVIIEKLNIRDPYFRFQAIVDVFDAELKIVSNRSNKPDVILCCLSDEVVKACWSVSRYLSKIERRLIVELKKQKESKQLLLFDEAVEEVEEDLMFRDLRRALKARAIFHRIPIQLTTNNLLIDSLKSQDASTRAWNFSVALYHKAGGIPWRLKSDGPETCFVGISFNHIKTTHKHLVRSSIAQAFSNKGDGFAIKGENIKYDPKEGRQLHLSKDQAFRLGREIINTYKDHTGILPMRIVLHKTSKFNEEEQDGFMDVFSEIPVVQFINLMPTQFRLLRVGNYPPKRGTLCQIGNKNYFFTTGFIPEIATYPGPHIPSPIQVHVQKGVDIYNTCQDILGLTRMNWNTAGITSGQPVTFSFSRNIGGIISELKADTEIPTEFKYFI